MSCGLAHGCRGRRALCLGSRFLANIADETESLARDGAYPALLLAAVTDSAACRIDPRCDRRIRNNAPVPHRGEQVVPADDAIAIANQELKEVEHLRLDRDQPRSRTQLAPLAIENDVGEKEHSDPK
jgi:hypothetical protein